MRAGLLAEGHLNELYATAMHAIEHRSYSGPEDLLESGRRVEPAELVAFLEALDAAWRAGTVKAPIMDSMVGYAAAIAAREGMPVSPQNDRAVVVAHFAPFMPLAALFIQTYLRGYGLAADAVAIRPDGDPLSWLAADAPPRAVVFTAAQFVHAEAVRAAATALAGRGIPAFAGGVAFQWHPGLAAGVPECRFPAGVRELADALRGLGG